MAERADHVMTVSRAAREYMREVVGIRRDDIEVVYLGFDFAKYAPDVAVRERVRREFGFGDDEFIIGYVGAVVPGKGHLQLIRAFAGIIEKVPNARLLLLGRGMLPEVKAAATELPKSQVVFAGWREDVSACLNAMDLFVQPSLSEAFSQVLIEAMGCGLPVVATDVGGASEAIENRANGILVPPDDAASISKEVVTLYRDREKRQAIAEAGLRSVRERFGVQQMVERHIELYQRWMG
jgi:glycosyltransferase involved in cell wall biosynthesis